MSKIISLKNIIINKTYKDIKEKINDSKINDELQVLINDQELLTILNEFYD